MSKEATATELLREWLDINDTQCRYDHHGYCQEHYLEEFHDCIVWRTRELLKDYDKDPDNTKIAQPLPPAVDWGY